MIIPRLSKKREIELTKIRKQFNLRVPVLRLIWRQRPNDNRIYFYNGAEK